jgi:hypothetical protein
VKKLSLFSADISDFSTTAFPLLKDLCLIQCSRLKSIPSSLSQLEQLSLCGCSGVSFSDSFSFPFLTTLSIERCKNITEMDFWLFPSLNELLVAACHGIHTLTFHNPANRDCSKSFSHLNIRGCSALTELKFHRNVGYLTIQDCYLLKEINIADSFRVYSLKISNGKSLLVQRPFSREEYQFPSISGKVSIQRLGWENQE